MGQGIWWQRRWKRTRFLLSPCPQSLLVCQATENGGEGSKEDLPSVEEFTEYPNWEKWLMHQMAAQRCAVSTLEDIQKPSVQCPGQPAVSGSVEQGSWTWLSQEITSNFHCSVFLFQLFSQVALLLRANADPYRPGLPFEHLIVLEFCYLVLQEFCNNKNQAK